MKPSFVRSIGVYSLLLLFLLAVSLTRANAAEWYRVVQVFDGDTIRLENNVTIRYLGVNTPEVRHKDRPEEPYGNEAREENRALVGGKKIRLEFDEERKDQYGRSLAYVYLEDGRMVNRILIERGLAWVLFQRPNIRHERAFLEDQNRAISGELGIWQIWKGQAGLFIGNEKSKRFHLKKCAYARNIAKKNRAIFNTSLDAFKKGYSPCKHCIDRTR
jgi:micrococcal nuclease